MPTPTDAIAATAHAITAAHTARRALVELATQHPNPHAITPLVVALSDALEQAGRFADVELEALLDRLDDALHAWAALA